MLSVVTIVAIATFRMQPVYVATARVEIDRENSNILPFQGTDAYDLMMDTDNYIETQAKILTSETLALQTIRNNGLSARPEYSAPGRTIGSDGHREPCEPETATGTWRVSGKLKREARAEQSIDGCQLRIDGPATGGANRKRAPARRMCNEISKASLIRRRELRTWLQDQLDELKTQSTEFGRCAHRL